MPNHKVVHEAANVKAHHAPSEFFEKQPNKGFINDLEHYKGERGRRGSKLPRGFQRVDGLQVELPA